jgi:phage tail sheath protein FI
VTRVADACIRETKAIAENFVGSLNTDAARVALKQQLIATFTRLERAGALVPSTDGSDPAFVVDVYSTQQDFAQGIVRVDIAVRPVRAIDYVYATIRVKN